MARYAVSMEVCSPDVIVEASSPEEAMEIAEKFIRSGCGDFQDLILAMDVSAESVEELDPDIYETSYGIDKENPYDLHDLDKE